jgi:hypothetical protein
VGQCIRVGSYNIKYFGNKGPAKSSTDIARLARRIAAPDQMNLDLVVLQEINKNGQEWRGAGGLLPRLRDLGYELAIEGNFGGDDPHRPQFVIILYRKTTLSLIEGSAANLDVPTSFDLNGPCEYRSLRPPVTASFKANEWAFRIVGVLATAAPVMIVLESFRPKI